MTKIVILGVLATIGLLMLFSCKTKKTVIDPTTTPGIVWGSGGGFTGKEVGFKLFESGEIYKTEGTSGSQIAMHSIKPKVAKAMYNAARELNLAEIVQTTPGNMYYFVEFQVDGKPHRVTWGDQQSETPAKIKDFYALLQQLLLKGTN